MDIFGNREYAHPLLAPESGLLSWSSALTDEPIDPELLVEVIEGQTTEEKGKGKEKDEQPLEIDVVQGLADDLSTVTTKRAHLLPLMESITTTRDRLCAVLSRAGEGLEPLHFTHSSSSSSSSSSS